MAGHIFGKEAVRASLMNRFFTGAYGTIVLVRIAGYGARGIGFDENEDFIDAYTRADLWKHHALEETPFST